MYKLTYKGLEVLRTSKPVRIQNKINRLNDRKNIKINVL